MDWGGVALATQGTSTFRRYYSMLDIESRDSTIAAVDHLRRSGYDFSPFLVRRWAIANGWKKMDAQLLDDFAAGVLAGVKYHYSDPMGRHAIETWRADALGREPWVDPGRGDTELYSRTGIETRVEDQRSAAPRVSPNAHRQGQSWRPTVTGTHPAGTRAKATCEMTSCGEKWSPSTLMARVSDGSE